MRIAVFNTFNPAPAENGGEIRMCRIYSRLSRLNDVRIVSYDLRCKKNVQREHLTDRLEIVDTLVTDADRWEFFQHNERLGLYPHDVLCIDDYIFSAAFITEVDAAIAWADCVVLTHPYLATFVLPRCRPLQLKIYEALNVEYETKSQFFQDARDREQASKFVAATRRCEALALHAVDIVLTTGEADSAKFVAEYGVDASKLRIIPNGVDTQFYARIPPEAKDAFRESIGIDEEQDVGVFLGSAYGPNVDGYRLARTWLDRGGFVGDVFVVGRISDVYNETWPNVGFTEHWLGFVDDVTKQLLMRSADFALHIITSGGGTNLKLFDYMTSGVPIIANEFGRRGVKSAGWFIPVNSIDDMRDVVATRRWQSDIARNAAQTATEIVRRDFDWDSIADAYQAILS